MCVAVRERVEERRETRGEKRMIYRKEHTNSAEDAGLRYGAGRKSRNK